MNTIINIGLGGGCHWCTEAVFQQLKGVLKVRQGYLSSIGENETFSEAILLTFDSDIISFKDIISVHLATHASTAAHSFRKKYRSAIYYEDEHTKCVAIETLAIIKKQTNKNYVTQVLEAADFKESRVSIQDYYKKNPNAPFCKRYIIPKFEKLNKDYSFLISDTS